MSEKVGLLLSKRYHLDAEIGQGGVGIVYRGHDTVLERAVAVKVLSAPELGTQDRTRLDWAEACLASGEPGDLQRARELLREAQAA